MYFNPAFSCCYLSKNPSRAKQKAVRNKHGTQQQISQPSLNSSQTAETGKDQLDENGEQCRSRGSSLLETILHNDSQSVNNTTTPQQRHLNFQNTLESRSRTSTNNDRQPKTAIVRPNIYQRTFSNFRGSSSCSNEGSEATISNLSMKNINETYKQQVNLFNIEKSPRESSRDLAPVCKNPKAVVRRRSLQLQSKPALSMKTDGCTSPPPRSTRPKTALTGSRSLPIENSMSLVLFRGYTRNELEARRTSSAPVSRVLTVMERDQLATQFIHVGHRALVDLGKKKSDYDSLSSTHQNCTPYFCRNF